MRHRRVAVSSILTIVILATCWIAFQHSRAYKAFFGLPYFDERAAGKIYDAVNKHQLVPVARGVVDLPKNLAGVTVDGKVYVTRRSDDLLVVLFIMRRGHDRDLSGYIFCNRPLSKADISGVDANYPELAIEVPQPDWLAPTDPDLPFSYVTLDRKFSPEKYQVSYTGD